MKVEIVRGSAGRREDYSAWEGRLSCLRVDLRKGGGRGRCRRSAVAMATFRKGRQPVTKLERNWIEPAVNGNGRAINPDGRATGGEERATGVHSERREEGRLCGNAV